MLDMGNVRVVHHFAETNEVEHSFFRAYRNDRYSGPRLFERSFEVSGIISYPALFLPASIKGYLHG
jgi:hypothetical protein